MDGFAVYLFSDLNTEFDFFDGNFLVGKKSGYFKIRQITALLGWC